MSYTIITTLTSKTDTIYESIDEWVSEHGPCGASSTYVESSEMVLNDDNTVTRTLVYASVEDRLAHKELAGARAELTYIPEFVYESEETPIYSD